MGLSRRDPFKMPVLGSAAIALPVERSVSGLSLGSSGIAGSALPAPFTTPFSGGDDLSVLLRRHLRVITPKAPISAMWRAVVSVATILLPGLLGSAFREPRVRGRLIPEALARPFLGALLGSRTTRYDGRPVRERDGR
jgi:hypothetical protein